MDKRPSNPEAEQTFEAFAVVTGPRLRAGLVATYGPEVGADAAASALAYGWENWDRLSSMDNPAGYLFRVGQTDARRANRKPGFLPALTPQDLPHFEPGLLPALEALGENQRVCVVLVHAFGWPQVEVAELLGVTPSTVKAHLNRAIAHLQTVLEIEPHV